MNNKLINKPLHVNIVELSQKDLLLQAVSDLEKFASNLREMEDRDQVNDGYKLATRLEWVRACVEKNML
jgi:hypothetical protein